MRHGIVLLVGIIALASELQAQEPREYLGPIIDSTCMPFRVGRCCRVGRRCHSRVSPSTAIFDQSEATLARN